MTETELKPIYDVIQEQTKSGLLSIIPELYNQIRDPVGRTLVEGYCMDKAESLGNKTLVDRTFRALRSEEKKSSGVNQIKPTVPGILDIMMHDEYYSRIKYNLMRNAPEIHYVDGKNVDIRRWEDADESESISYLEERYGIYDNAKHKHALKMFFRTREYNPLLELVEQFEWDGVNRCEHFLHKWAGADDDLYTEEVSRLIFAGGINRLYCPGCKFDDVPVLVGTSQGEGKSTLVRWLALNDMFYSEVMQMDGKEGIEALDGAWICEISELLALTKTKEQEAVKAYITRQRDHYRKPYAENSTDVPRRCIFIGTTNNSAFLRDKTGNRRFYPVTCRSKGYELYKHEDECRWYIMQCWAEARERYKNNVMPAYADPDLVAEYKKAQENAMEDDWRVGAIESYLKDKRIGDCVCVRMLKREALCYGDDASQDPSYIESREIGQIMQNMKNWKKSGTRTLKNYGRQKVWTKVADMEEDDMEEDNPFTN